MLTHFIPQNGAIRILIFPLESHRNRDVCCQVCVNGNECMHAAELGKQFLRRFILPTHDEDSGCLQLRTFCARTVFYIRLCLDMVTRDSRYYTRRVASAVGKTNVYGDIPST